MTTLCVYAVVKKKVAGVGGCVSGSDGAPE